MFTAKKILAGFLLPPTPLFILLLVALMLLCFTKRQRLGQVLAFIATALLIAITYTSTANFLLKYLENQYQPFSITAKNSAKRIVVLSGSSYDLPAYGHQPYGSTGLRMLEGVSVFKQLPQETKLIISGTTNDTKAMAMAALVMGVPESNIITEGNSSDTKDSVNNVKRIVGGDNFVLVTSAFHMPRAIRLFKKQGLSPIPAPTDYCSKSGDNLFSLHGAFPDPRNIFLTSQAINEYIGIAYYWVVNDI